MTSSRSLSTLLLVPWMLHACVCGVPVTPGDDDAGAQVTADAGPVDASQDFVLAGRLWAQLQDGQLVEVDLASGAVQTRLGGLVPQGAVVVDGDALLLWSMFPPDGSNGRFWRWDPDRGELTPQSQLPWLWPKALDSDGVHVAMSGGVGQTIYYGSLQASETLAEHPVNPVGSGIAFDDVGLVLGRDQGTGYADQTTTFSPLHCEALAYDRVQDRFLCGTDINYTWGARLGWLQRDGTFTELATGPGGDAFRAITLLADGTYIATHAANATVESNATWLPAGLDALRPVQFAELDGVLYAGLEQRGLVSIDAQGVTLRMPFATAAGAVACDGTTLALSDDDLQAWLMNPDLSGAQRFDNIHGLRGIAFAPDGTALVAMEDGLLALDRATGSRSLLYAQHDALTDLAATAQGLLLAAGAAGVLRAAWADLATPQPLHAGPAERLAACDSGVVLFNPDADRLERLDDAGHAETAQTALSTTLGTLTALTCIGELVIVATDDGALHARPLRSDLPWKQGPALDAAAASLAPRP